MNINEWFCTDSVERLCMQPPPSYLQQVH